jgi:glycosyltransferase involved in cell wall biosynthesis
VAEPNRIPKVSVVVPNYNYAAFLRERLDSILNQTYSDFEVILIDDASTDSSLQIISGYLADRRIQTVFRKENSGNLFKNWNLGVRMARGEYVWIAEADDHADSRFLEILVKQLDENPAAGLAYCQSYKVDENGNILGSMLDYTGDLDNKRWEKSFINNGKDECSRYMVFKNTIPNASAVLFRKRIYIRAGYADESIYYGNDWLTWIFMMQISDVAFVCEHLNFYRCHPESVREEMDLTEHEIMGSYLVLKFILSHQELDRQIKKRVYRYRVRAWVNIFFRGRKRFDRTLTRKIFNLVRPFDKLIYFRFFREFLLYPLRIALAKLRSLGMKLKKIFSREPGNG